MKAYCSKDSFVAKFVKIILILTIFFFLLISQKVYAITSSVSGNWSVGATWAGGVVPGTTAVDDVTILAGHNITLDNDTNALNSLTVTGTLTDNAAKTVTVSGGGHVEINGSIRFTSNSILNISNGGNLTINSAGLLTQGSGAISTNDFTVNNNGAFTQGGNLTVAGNTDVTLATWTIQSGTFAPTGTGDVTGNLTISSTGTLTQGANRVTVTGNLTIDGSGGVFTANAAATNINIGGNWSNSGTFTANGSTVVFTDADHTLNGSTSFNNFNPEVATSRTLTFESSATQTITGLLTLKGSSGGLLNLMSDTTAAWNLNRAGTYDIDYVDVEYSNNTGTAISVQASSNTNSGNNSGWNFTSSTSTAIPTLSEWGMIIFTILLGASAVFAIRRRDMEDSI
ncbi:MAG: IPTL-CTERM sorting domain-containing protein [Desulfobacula sp.]|uniref:IPTL-CTERM sorting domain-containing protein n=1 Tax=Desulfobacula sp. TaxID=2593537 RepID=UPI001ECD5B7D|nr:IPTL-CTERM sorting domain-containing protein [Desulfobacula sp.]